MWKNTIHWNQHAHPQGRLFADGLQRAWVEIEKWIILILSLSGSTRGWTTFQGAPRNSSLATKLRSWQFGRAAMAHVQRTQDRWHLQQIQRQTAPKSEAQATSGDSYVFSHAQVLKQSKIRAGVFMLLGWRNQPVSYCSDQQLSECVACDPTGLTCS